MIRIKADFAALKRYRAKMARSPALLKTISVNVAEELLSLVQEGFRNQADPFGRAWAPKKHPDGRAILVGKTARLRRGWHVTEASRGRVTIEPSVEYADYHQQGTRRMVARKMLPDDTLPKSWSDAIEEVALEILKDHFDG